MFFYIYRKSYWGEYTLFKINEPRDKKLDIISTIFEQQTYFVQRAYDYLIGNFNVEGSGWGAEFFFLSKFELDYDLNENEILVSRLMPIIKEDGTHLEETEETKEYYEVVVEKSLLLHLTKSWVDVVYKNPEEIMLYKTEDGKIDISGKFPLGECLEIPHLIYRKTFSSKKFSRVETFIYGEFFFNLSILFEEISKNDNDANIIVNFLNSIKEKNKENQMNLENLIVKIIDDKTILLKEIFEPMPDDRPQRKLEISVNNLYYLLNSWNEYNKNGATEIVISKNDDGSLKVVASSYEPIEYFPKYRCYP